MKRTETIERAINFRTPEAAPYRSRCFFTFASGFVVEHTPTDLPHRWYVADREFKLSVGDKDSHRHLFTKYVCARCEETVYEQLPLQQGEDFDSLEQSPRTVFNWDGSPSEAAGA